MKRRVLSLVLAVVLVCALLPTVALAADITVTQVIPCKYDWASRFSEGLAAVGIDTGEKNQWGTIYKWGFVDKAGKEVVPCKYEWANSFSEGLAAVYLNGKYGYIDKTGKEVVPYKYDNAWEFSEGLAPVGFYTGEQDELGNFTYQWGYIDKTGKEVIPCKYDGAYPFIEGLARVYVGKYPDIKWGYIDKTGREIIPCKYDTAWPFYEGLTAVELNDKWGFIDKTGREVIPCKYVDALFFSEGLAAVQGENYWWGYIDKTGKEVIPCKYSYTFGFCEGLAGVYLNGKYGYIDKTGKEVIPCKYDLADNFSEGLAWVELNGKVGYIDKAGREVVPCKYERGTNNNEEGFSEGLAAVKLNGKWGYLAIDGYVPLELEGGSGTGYIIADSSDILNAPTNPTKEGYTFGGWYTDEALTIPWNFNDKVVNTLTLYAKWVPVSSTATTTGKSQSVISLNGNTVTLDAYTLKAVNGGDVTYVKLRDVAALLENTRVKFNVDWRRGAIYVSTKTAYTTKNGTELKAISGTDGSYKWNTAPVLFDGTTKALEGIVLTDGNGGGHTFFKLRDLGEAIGFTVGWSAEKGIYIETK